MSGLLRLGFLTGLFEALRALLTSAKGLIPAGVFLTPKLEDFQEDSQQKMWAEGVPVKIALAGSASEARELHGVCIVVFAAAK